jgi:diguanylate cyclase (GGDEF)-like protein/PAS domain S-box-containing protein
MNSEIKTDKVLPENLALHRSEEKFRVLFERSPIGMAMVDNATGKFLEVNSSLLNSTGYTKQEFLKLSFWDITPIEYEPQEMSQLKSLKAKGCFGPNEKEYIRKDRSRYPIKISGFLLTDIDGREVVWGLIEDISEQKAFEKNMLHLALHDSLTELPNRRLLSDRINQSISFSDRYQTKVGLMIIDLDNFKPVNDTFGHAIGDSLLKAIATRLTNIKHRKIDTIARLGGDEFVILLPEIYSIPDIETFAEKVVGQLSTKFSIKGNMIDISVSIGIAIYPDHANDELTLMKKADSALYQVKEGRKNGYKTFGK